MKTAKKKQTPKPAETVPAKARRPIWYWLGGAGLALLVTLELYRPAIGGPFLLDDFYLPFLSPDVGAYGFRQWINYGRPVLMISFWLNYQLWGADPAPYHVVNVLIHFCCAVLVGLILHRLLSWAGEQEWRRDLWVAFGTGVFLLHPLQTEAVSYIASRSDVLSVTLLYAALAVFLYRPETGAGWIRAIGLLVLLGAAAMTKEHAAVFPAVVLLADLLLHRGSFRRQVTANWRVYALMVVSGLVGAAMVGKVLFSASTAGFGLREFPWYQYFYTQCRALWLYVRLYALPLGQNLDPDFAISRNIFDHGAIIGLAALAASLALAWRFRRDYPLSAFGWLSFLLLMAPTSSVVPILDPVAERRVYLGFLGLLILTVDLLRRWRASRNVLLATAAVVCLALGALTFQRNRLYESAVAIWSETAEKSPNKVRPRFQLAYAYYQEGRCQEANGHYARAASLAPPDTRLLVNWALSLDCAGQPEQALQKLQQAARMENTAHIHATIGMVYGKQGRHAEALAALEQAERIEPNFAMTYVYRGHVHAAMGDYDKSMREYQRALQIQPSNQAAAQALETVRRNLPGAR